MLAASACASAAAAVHAPTHACTATPFGRSVERAGQPARKRGGAEPCVGMHFTPRSSSSSSPGRAQLPSWQQPGGAHTVHGLSVSLECESQPAYSRRESLADLGEGPASRAVMVAQEVDELPLHTQLNSGGAIV